MGSRRFYAPALCAALCLAGAFPSVRAQQAGDAPGAAPKGNAPLGAQRFMEYCAACHGSDGRGGAKAPSLAGPSTANRSDTELFAIVRDGTRAGMPPFAQIGNANIAALVHFLRLLQNNGAAETSPAQQKPPGVAIAGRALYFGKAGCSSCHMMNGHGGFIARSLTGYGRNRDAAAIRSAITNPDNPLVPSTRVVIVTTRAGQKFTGVLRNEDNFNVDLQTLDGRYHLLARSQLTNVDYTDHSLMPRDYAARLSPADLDNIVSFLMASGRSRQLSEAPAQ